MTRWLFLWCFLGSVLPVSAQRTLHPKWKGILSQHIGGSVSDSPFAIWVTLEGRKATGTSYIEASEYLNLAAKMRWEGTFDGKVLRMQEVELLQGDVLGNGVGWCIKKIVLTLSADGLTLSGRWEGYDPNGNKPCTPGTVRLERAVDLFEGVLVDSLTQQPISGKIGVSQPSTGQPEISLEIDSEGEVSFKWEVGRYYRLSAQAEGYFSKTWTIRGQSEEEMEASAPIRIALRPIRKGDVLVMQGVNFAQSSAVLSEEAKTALRETAAFLKANPRVVVEIAGHTTNEGDEQLNRELSFQRATEVVKYLQYQGVNRYNLVPKGYGSARPLGSNDDPETRKLNRRVELRVLYIKE